MADPETLASMTEEEYYRAVENDLWYEYSQPSRSTPVAIQQHPSGHENPKVADVIYVLRDFYQALEEGRAASMEPDWDYQRRNGKPPWTDEEIDRIIAIIDFEIEHEIAQRPTYWADRGWHQPTDFKRLEPLQRRALVQFIDKALAKFDQKK